MQLPARPFHSRLARPPPSLRPPTMLRRVYSLAFLVFGFGTSAARADEPPQLLPADRPIEQVVDHYIDATLKEDKVSPAALAPDAELLRRLTLDLNGRIPTVAETDAYLASGDPPKKLPLVDRLLASACFARHQAQEFAALI